MSDELKQAREHVRDLKNRHGARDQMLRQMDKLYWMEWDEEGRVVNQLENPKITRSPRARNAIEGIVRLLCASDPTWSVPADINNSAVKRVADKMEKFCQAMWFGAGRISGAALHYDIVRSAALYGEAHISLISTKDLAAYSKGTINEDRAAEVAERVPFLFQVTNPQEGYPEYDIMGLNAFYRQTKMTIASLKTNFGQKAEDAINAAKNPAMTDYTEVTVNNFYNLKNNFVWIDQSEQPIIEDEHKLAFIPIVSQIVGSHLFTEEEKKREPILYALDRSKLMDRENMMLTVMYTMLFAIGTNPMFTEYLINPENPPAADYSKSGGTIRYRVGERREVMAKQVIDPAMMQAWSIAQELEMESTIYRQTLGEPIGANSPYSMVALLSQAGRLPLLIPQRLSGEAIGAASELALKWTKKEGWKASAKGAGASVEIQAKDIPKQFEIIAKLDIALPQDRLASANAANLLGSGDNPLVSKEWILSEILNVQQPARMTEQIWKERAKDLFYRKFILQQMQEIGVLEQQVLQPPGTNATGLPGTLATGGPAAQEPGATEGTPEFAPGSLNNPFQPIKPYPPMTGPGAPGGLPGGGGRQ